MADLGTLKDIAGDGCLSKAALRLELLKWYGHYAKWKKSDEHWRVSKEVCQFIKVFGNFTDKELKCPQGKSCPPGTGAGGAC